MPRWPAPAPSHSRRTGPASRLPLSDEARRNLRASWPLLRADLIGLANLAHWTGHIVATRGVAGDLDLMDDPRQHLQADLPGSDGGGAGGHAGDGDRRKS